MESENIVSQVSRKRIVLHEHIPLSTPLVIYIEPSGYCNLKCKFCPHGVPGPDFKKDVMSLSLFKKLIDGLADFPDQVQLLRVCGNGESLINKNIKEMLQYAYESRRARRLELVTNGVLLTPDLIQSLPRFTDRIICSVEGLCSEEYERVSGVKIDFEAFRKNLAALYANKGNSTIHIKAHSEAAPTEELKQKFFDMFGASCDEIYVENLVPMWPQYNTEFSTNKFRWGSEVTARRICAQLFKGIQVQADGEVVPCCVDWNRANVIGNLNSESVYEVWNGSRLRKLQLAHLRGEKALLEPCSHCTMNDYCEIDNIDSHAEECIRRILEKDGRSNEKN